MRKLKIYLDTSVISYLDQQDAPEKMKSTLKFWEVAKTQKFDVCVSDVTIGEIKRCEEPKRSILLDFLESVNYNIFTADNEVYEIAQQFIENGILTQKSVDDCRHIACAIVNGCDCIVSWNFKHIVNEKTIKGVKIVSTLTRYNEIAIYTPEYLMEED